MPPKFVKIKITKNSSGKVINPQPVVETPGLIAARNEIAMEESNRRTHEKAIQNRPVNTTKSYTKKQQEFIAWCDKRQFASPSTYTVTSNKLHLFLEEEVVNRPRKVQRKNGNNGTALQRVGNETVKQYTNAIIDLYNQQVQHNANSNPHPRQSNVRLLIKNYAAETAQKKRENYDDRAAGTLLDGYTSTETLIDISNAYWTKSSGAGLRDRAAFLLCHALFLRGENARMIELPDMFSIQLENECPSQTCTALVVLLDKGKMNSFGRVEYAGCLRHLKVEACPISAVAFHFFFRFMVHNEPFPDMTSSASWYDTKFMNTASSNTETLSYVSHRKSIQTVFNQLHLPFNKKTHIGRGSGARMAELAGASDAQIRRHGRWNSNSLDTCYLTNLPREILRTSAGFSPILGSYFLKRDSFQPPLELQRLIFPEIEYWLNHQQQTSQPNLAAVGFLNLLQFLRKVILQDAVELLNMGKSHPVLNHEIFKSAAFLRYKEQLSNVIREEHPEPQDVLIQRALPLLSEKIYGFERRSSLVNEELKELVRTLSAQVQSLNSKIDQQNAIIRQQQDCIQKMANFFQNGSSSYLKLQKNIATQNEDLQNEECSLNNNRMKFPGEKSDLEHAPNAPQDIQADVSIEHVQSKATSFKNATNVMSRGINDCVNLWKEWSVGYNGKPPIRDLEMRFGATWRSSTESKWLKRRLPIIREIENVSKQKKVSCETAAQYVDTRMKSLQFSNLHSFGLHLAKLEKNSQNSEKSQDKAIKKPKRIMEAISITEQTPSSKKSKLLSEEKACVPDPGENDQYMSNDEPGESDQYMSIDNINRSSKWSTLPYPYPKYFPKRHSLTYKKTVADGLCFYYSLRVHGILDPREKIIAFLENPANIQYVSWWKEIVISYKSNSIQDIVDLLRAAPDNELFDVWVNSDLMYLISIALKLKIFILNQQTMRFEKIHEILESYCPFEVTFERSLLFYFHQCNSPEIIGTNTTSNHYVPLRLHIHNTDERCETMPMNNLEQWIDCYNSILDDIAKLLKTKELK
jgi:hypothetical protein